MKARIQTAQNGFIVYPDTLPHETAENEIVVFETIEHLLEYLKEYFGPLVKTSKD